MSVHMGHIQAEKSYDAMGRLLMVALSILAAMPLILGFWAGGGFS